MSARTQDITAIEHMRRRLFFSYNVGIPILQATFSLALSFYMIEGLTIGFPFIDI
jgi:hypothetical protein